MSASMFFGSAFCAALGIFVALNWDLCRPLCLQILKRLSMDIPQRTRDLSWVKRPRKA